MNALLDDIVIEHGPVELLHALFQSAYRECVEAGVQLSFAPIETLLEVNQNNLDSWLPLLAILDHEISVLTPENTYCIVGRAQDGRIIYTRAARLYDLTSSGSGENYRACVESLRHIYADPAPARERGERWLANGKAASAMEAIKGRVAFSGGVWCHPDFRKRGFTLPASLIGRAYSYARWGNDYTVTFMTRGVIGGGHAKKTGYSNVVWSVDATNTKLGDLELAFLWSDTHEILRALEHRLGRSQ